MPALFVSSLPTKETIDHFLIRDNSLVSIGNSGTPPILQYDRLSFARTMRLDSKQFMNFWQFAAADQTIRNLIFYKEASFLEDSLAAQTAASSLDESRAYSSARNAGLTQSMIRFLVNDQIDGEPALFSSRDPISKVPRIPVGPIPAELKYSFETVINSFILSAPAAGAKALIAIPLELKNSVFSKFAGPNPVSQQLSTDILDACVDSVLLFLYEQVFRRYVGAVTDYQQVQLNQASPISETSRGGAGSFTSSLNRRGNNGSLFLDAAMREDEFSHLGQRVSTPRLDEEEVGASSFSGPYTSDRQNSGNSSGRRESADVAPAPVFLYSIATHSERSVKINSLLDMSGFIERKDAQPVKIEYTRACFVRVMDTTSVAYRDFSKFAQKTGFKHHLLFLDQITRLDDQIASQIRVPASSSMHLPKSYARARNEFKITQHLSRFIQSTPSNSPSYAYLAKLPQLPRIPIHALPDSLQAEAIDIYGTFIGKNSEMEIEFAPGRRIQVQNLLQQTFLKELKTDLLDACADDVVGLVYEHAFCKYVKACGGSMSDSKESGEFVGAGTAELIGGSISGKAKSGFRKDSSVSATSAGGFFAGLFGGGRKGKKPGSFSSIPASPVEKERVAIPMSEVTPPISSTMLYSPAERKEMVGLPQTLDVSYTYSSFLNVMRVEGALFKEFKQFAQNNLPLQSRPEECQSQSNGNLRLYQAVCTFEDQLAAATPSLSPEDTLNYNFARANGLTQPLSRFIQHILETNAFGSGGDLHTRTLLPRIPIHSVHSNLKTQCIDIFNTYISEATATVETTIPPPLRQKVQSEIEHDYLIPFMTDVFDACLDQVVAHLYQFEFAAFVASKNSSKGGLVLQPYGVVKHEPVHASSPPQGLTSILKSHGVAAPPLNVFATRRPRDDSFGSFDSPGGSVGGSLVPASPRVRSPPSAFGPSRLRTGSVAKAAKSAEKALLI
ncbi:hypothetical protein HDU98_003688 [Podochytrium sp. JEL0797]|nr:hypothetical protein HDU98_003688 [Podochytrium sp. JEL0797]